jgi:2-haloacid dehalogenase
VDGDGAIDAVVFDLGGVVIEWDPRRLYRKLIEDEDEIERFLGTVCTPSWNAEHDRGVPFAEGVERLARRFPEHRALIEAYHVRWDEMLGGEVAGTRELLEDLRDAGVRLLALSNWSAETFPIAAARFDALRLFEGILVSAEVGAVKPEPAIFEAFSGRFGVRPERCVFIDDVEANVRAASEAGFDAIRFRSAPDLRAGLVARGLLGIDDGSGAADGRR